MSLQIIGAGFGRTGTMSIKAALERLGFAPCEHMGDLFAAPERTALWLDAAERKARGESIEWAPLLAGYRATVDWPGCFFWRELVAAYPDAKVLLNVRDPERWYDSAARTIFPATQGSSGDEARFADAPPEVAARVRAGLRLIDTVIWDGTFHGRFADRASAIRVFEEHNAAVRAAVPADRVLVYEVQQGWEPLSRFLGVPIPNGEPFPHLNDAGAFLERVEAHRA